MRLSYSNYRRYLDCPRAYYNIVNKVEPPEIDSKYNALYGKLIESFFKTYTNVYTKEGRQLTDSDVRSALKSRWNYILENNYVCWSDPWCKESSEQIFESAYEDTLKNMAAFDFWKEARSEVSIEIRLRHSNDQLTSRLDFIWTKPDGGVEILDGKGTKKIDTNVDMEQLYFYALMYLLRYGKLPDKLGFLYYRYQMIKYLDFTKDTIVDFKNKLVLVKNAIKKDEEFTPKVKLSKQCKWCSYKFSCNAYTQKKQANADKRAAKSSIKADPAGDVMDLPAGLL